MPQPEIGCPDCDGTGSLDEDYADWRGEHCTREVTCSTCDGAGVLKSKEPDEGPDLEDDNPDPPDYGPDDDDQVEREILAFNAKEI